MLRVALVIVGFLAACSAHAHGPAWPKASKTATDGGESLAPRAGAVTAIEESADIAPAEPGAAKIDKPAVTPPVTPTVTPPVTPPPTEEPINLEDQVIEVGGD